MHPQWRRLGSRIEYGIARPRVDSGRGGLGCVAHGGRHQSLGKHCESLSRRKCELDQMREVPFVRKADDLALATSHLAQSSSTSRLTAGVARILAFDPAARPAGHTTGTHDCLVETLRTLSTKTSTGSSQPSNKTLI